MEIKRSVDCNQLQINYSKSIIVIKIYFIEIYCFANNTFTYLSTPIIMRNNAD